MTIDHRAAGDGAGDRRARRVRVGEATARRPRRALSRWGVAAVVGALVALAGCSAPQPESPTEWVARTAAPLAGTDPGTDPSDLAPLARIVGDAQVVGLGESTHGVSEELTLKHRALRQLVEQLGFRSIAWEEDWTLGREINEYLRTGVGSADALVGRMSPQWQSREVTDVLRWLRAFNAERPDKVQFVGVEYYATPAQAYDDLDAYVARVAPGRLPELRARLAPIRPSDPNIYAWIQRFAGVADKRPYVDHARRVDDLVQALPHRPGDRDHAVAAHTAEQIVAFHEHYRLSDADGLVYRDAHAAQNLRWWRDLTGDKVVYWAASPHTANAPRMRLTGPPAPDMTFPSAGSHLRHWYGAGYRSIGFTVGHGAASTGPGTTTALPAPAPDRVEYPLSQARPSTFVLDLHAPAPPAVRAWLDTPATYRGLPGSGPDGAVDGGSPAEWFDAIVHHQNATPAT